MTTNTTTPSATSKRRPLAVQINLPAAPDFLKASDLRWWEYRAMQRRLAQFVEMLGGYRHFGVQFIAGAGCYTDFTHNRVVIDPAMVKARNDVEHLAIVKAMLAHESAHVRFTIPAYGLDTTEMNAKTKLTARLCNLLEDERIERALAHEFWGAERHLFLLKRRMWEQSEPVTADDSPINVISAILQLRFGNEVKGPLSALNQTLLEACRPHYVRAWNGIDSNVVREAANEIIKILGLEAITEEQLKALQEPPCARSMSGKRQDGAQAGPGGRTSRSDCPIHGQAHRQSQQSGDPNCPVHGQNKADQSKNEPSGDGSQAGEDGQNKADQSKNDQPGAEGSQAGEDGQNKAGQSQDGQDKADQSKDGRPGADGSQTGEDGQDKADQSKDGRPGADGSQAGEDGSQSGEAGQDGRPGADGSQAGEDGSQSGEAGQSKDGQPNAEAQGEGKCTCPGQGQGQGQGAGDGQGTGQGTGQGQGQGDCSCGEGQGQGAGDGQGTGQGQGGGGGQAERADNDTSDIGQDDQDDGRGLLSDEELEEILEEAARELAAVFAASGQYGKGAGGPADTVSPLKPRQLSDATYNAAVARSQVLRRQLERIPPRPRSYAAENGSRYSFRDELRRDDRPMRKREQPTPKRKIAIGVLVDCSGSMGGIMEEVRKAVLATYFAADALKVPMAVWGFSDWSRNPAATIVPYGMNNRLAPEAIAGLAATGGTVLAPALRKAREAVRGVPADRRVLLVIHDGQPYDMSESVKQVKAMSRETEVVGIFLGSGYTNADLVAPMRELFADRLLVADDADALMTILGAFIYRLLRPAVH